MASYTAAATRSPGTWSEPNVPRPMPGISAPPATTRWGTRPGSTGSRLTRGPSWQADRLQWALDCLGLRLGVGRSRATLTRRHAHAGCRSRPPDDDLERQHHRLAGRGALPEQSIDHQVRGATPDVVRGLRGDREEWLIDPFGRQVVERHDRDVVRHPEPELAQRADGPEGNEVVGREDRRRRVVGRLQHLTRHSPAVGQVHVSEVEAAIAHERLVERQARLGKRAADTGDAVDRRRDAASPGEDGDPAMAEL